VSEIEIAREISTNKGDGFDESTMRIISENGRKLKFKRYGFEEG
jgi:hypothetical protein